MCVQKILIRCAALEMMCSQHYGNGVFSCILRSRLGGLSVARTGPKGRVFIPNRPPVAGSPLLMSGNVFSGVLGVTDKPDQSNSYADIVLPHENHTNIHGFS